MKFEEISNQMAQNPDSLSDIITPQNNILNNGDNKEHSSPRTDSLIDDLAQK